MKKFLLFVFMFMLVIPVKGLENENTIRKYKYYRLEKVEGPFVLKTEENEEYPLIDEESYIEEALSELSIDKPEEKEGRKIYEYDGFHYARLLKANKVEIKVSEGYALKNVSIESSDGEVYYSNKDATTINGGSTNTYELNKLYDFRDLTIKANPGNDKDIQTFYICFKYNDQVISEIAISTLSKNIKVPGTYGNIKENAYEDIYTLNELDDLIYKGPVKLYQYQDYKYQSYKLVREYYDEYLTEPFEDYIYKDEDDFIDVLINNTIDSNTNELVLVNNKVSEDIQTKPETNEIVKTNNEPSNTDNKIKESVSSSSKNNIPTQSGKIVNVKNKPINKKTSNENIYYYFLLVILIILLLLAIKCKNKLKEQYGWYEFIIFFS